MCRWLFSIFLFSVLLSHSFASQLEPHRNTKNSHLYQWSKTPEKDSIEAHCAQHRLDEAIANPEYMMEHWVALPNSPNARKGKRLYLTLREAILLALRYNPNIQNAELDRVIQRYQLRLAHNEFELQYALAGSANFEKNRYSGVGSSITKTYVATPELGLKTKLGTSFSLRMNNNVGLYNSYNPEISISLTQPLLRGFGTAVNEAELLNAIDNEVVNQLNLRQSVINQITQVINAYRALINSGNNLKNQKRQLKEAKRSFEINEKKIAAGQLEPTGNIQQSYQIESLSLMVEQAENDFKTAAQNLLQTIGLDPQLRLSVPSNVKVKHIVIPDLKHSIEIALEHNTNYIAQKLAYKADQRAYLVARNEQLWKLDLSANLQTGKLTDVDGNQGFNRIYNGSNMNQNASLTLKIPLNDLGRRSKLINAKLKLEKDRINLLAMKRALITDVTNLINSIESQAKRIRLAEKQVKLAEQSYVLQKKRREAGISTALDVNNTQNQLIQAQSGLIAAKITYLNQLSSLKQLQGTTLDYWNIKLRYGK